MNIDELWEKYSVEKHVTNSKLPFRLMDKIGFTEAIVEIISNPVEARVMQKRFLTAYKQRDEKYMVAIQYYDEQQRRCTMFVDTCGNELVADTLVELIKFSA